MATDPGSTKATPAELLSLLIDQAPKLRAAGVESGEVDGLKFTLRPHEVEVPDDFGDDDPKPSDALHDPATYGRRGVPGNPRREPRQ